MICFRNICSKKLFGIFLGERSLFPCYNSKFGLFVDTYIYIFFFWLGVLLLYSKVFIKRYQIFVGDKQCVDEVQFHFIFHFIFFFLGGGGGGGNF